MITNSVHKKAFCLTEIKNVSFDIIIEKNEKYFPSEWILPKIFERNYVFKLKTNDLIISSKNKPKLTVFVENSL